MLERKEINAKLVILINIKEQLKDLISTSLRSISAHKNFLASLRNLTIKQE
jgi:hypothetical protein